MAHTLPPLPYPTDALEPHIDKLTMESPAPLLADSSLGHYPYPQPGILRDREF